MFIFVPCRTLSWTNNDNNKQKQKPTGDDALHSYINILSLAFLFLLFSTFQLYPFLGHFTFLPFLPALPPALPPETFLPPAFIKRNTVLLSTINKYPRHRFCFSFPHICLYPSFLSLLVTRVSLSLSLTSCFLYSTPSFFLGSFRHLFSLIFEFFSTLSGPFALLRPLAYLMSFACLFMLSPRPPPSL